MLKRVIKTQRGFALVEVLMAMALLGLVATAFLMGISIATKSIYIADEMTTAESLARSQLEFIKEQEYKDSGVYLEIVTPDNYTIVTPIIEEIQSGLQRVTIIVKHHDYEVFTLEGYKVDAGVY